MSKKCSDCLWNWEDVSLQTKDRICYNREAKRYHQKCPRAACKYFEKRVSPVANLHFIWGRNNYVMPHWKGGEAQ